MKFWQVNLLTVSDDERKQINVGRVKKEYSLLITYDILNTLSKPKFVQMSWQFQQRRIVLRVADKDEEGVLDVPEGKNENSIFALPGIIEQRNPIAVVGWGDTPHSVEARLVYD